MSEAEGSVTVTRADGTLVELNVGDPIFQGDSLETGANASVAVVFVDDTIFTLDEGGHMVMDEMVYDPGSQTGNFSASVAKGVFSFVSGNIAKTSPDGMVVDTPTTTIGIRGSTVVGEAGSEGSENSITLVKDVDGNVGEIVIQTKGGTLVLNQDGASTTVFSANTAPGPMKIMSQQDMQSKYGGNLTKLIKVVSNKAKADAKRAEEKADQAKKDADQAKEDADKADQAAKAAEAKLAAAEASGDEQEKAAAEAELAVAKAAADAAAADAATKATEAEAAQVQADQAQTFSSMADAAYSVQQTLADQASKATTTDKVTNTEDQKTAQNTTDTKPDTDSDTADIYFNADTGEFVPLPLPGEQLNQDVFVVKTVEKKTSDTKEEEGPSKGTGPTVNGLKDARQGLDFDGVNDYVQIADSTSLSFTTTQSRTIEVWIKTTDTGAARILTKPDGSVQEYSLMMELSAGGQTHTGKIAFTNGGGWLIAHDKTVNDGEWHHVAAVYNVENGLSQIYIDGAAQKVKHYYSGAYSGGDASVLTAQAPLSSSYSSNSLYIGNYDSSSSYSEQFDGQIDDVRLWKSARSGTEIKANMHSGISGSETDLAGWWKLSEASNGQVTDASTNANTATLGSGVAGDDYDPTVVTANPINGFTVDENAKFVGTLETSDPEGQALTYVVGAAPAHGTISLGSTGSFVYTPTTGYSGRDNFIFRAEDTDGNNVDRTFEVTVKDVYSSVSWTGTTSSDWNTATNWSTGAVPTVTSDVTISGGTNTLNWNVDNTLANSIKIASGTTVYVTNDISYAGRITENAGTITFNTSGHTHMQLNEFVLNSGTLNLNSSSGFGGYLRYTGTMTNTGTINVLSNTNGGDIRGSLTNEGTISTASTLSLTAYDGVYKNSGTITIGTGEIFNLTNVGAFTNQSGGTLTLGSGSTLDSTKGSLDVTPVNEGTMEIGGSGTAGTTTITGNLTLANSSTLKVDITGSTTKDLANVSGSVTYAGTVDANYSSYTPSDGTAHTVMTAGSSTVNVIKGVTHNLGSTWFVEVDVTGNNLVLTAHQQGAAQTGTSGNDTLTGANGTKDFITGGAGTDTLTGGTGVDLFIYTSTSDSAVGSGDTISDFEASDTDIIQLKGLLTGTWDGTITAFTTTSATFSNTGNLQMAFNDTSDLLQIDTNGDGSADMDITLTGVSSANLDHTDFAFV